VHVIHPAAAAFDTAANAYESARPGYPPAAIEWLRIHLDLNERTTLVDLAAGTGKLTRELAPLAGRTIAIEPVEGMRRKLHESLPEVDCTEGTAESIPLADDSVDAMTIAQAFHWFDSHQAAKEIHRVLKPAGHVAILWNKRDLTDPVQDGIEEIVSRYRRDTPSYRTSQWGGMRELFDELATGRIPFAQELTREGLVERVASISFISDLAADEKHEAMTAARKLAASLKESIVLPHTTELHLWAPTRTSRT
jgi:ubiquinone/menaquinone biosynthesis C-methylase UbiE